VLLKSAQVLIQVLHGVNARHLLHYLPLHLHLLLQALHLQVGKGGDGFGRAVAVVRLVLVRAARSLLRAAASAVIDASSVRGDVTWLLPRR
jgi:hypothetical protein